MFSEGNLCSKKGEQTYILREWRVTKDDVRWNCVMHTHSSRRWSSAHYHWHATKDASTLFTQSWQGSNSSCVTTAQDAKSLCRLGSLKTHGRTFKKMHWSSTQHP